MNGLSGGKLKECTQLIQDSADAEDVNDEEEEDVDALLTTLNEHVDRDTKTTLEQKVVAKLLVKIRAFITKVCTIYP